LSGSRGRGEERAILDADETGRKQVVVAHDRPLQSVNTLTVCRARSPSVAVVTLVEKNRLYLNASRECLGDTFRQKTLRYQQTARFRTIQVCPKD
jgi:hypothetical protein